MAADATLLPGRRTPNDSATSKENSNEEEAQLSARMSMVAKLSPSKQKLLYFLVAFLTFLVADFTVLYGTYRHAASLVMWTVVVLGSLVGYLWWFQNRDVYYLPLSISMGFGLAVGLLAGLYNYDINYVFVEFYGNSELYRDVAVDEKSLADAFRDAGTLTFKPDSFVDTTRSVGWKAANGNVYCIAPVVPESSPAQARVEFWAVGVNCCSSVGHFFCDDSEKLDVHSGAVVFDSNGWFAKSNFDYYELARRKAMGEFSLTNVNVNDKAAKPTYIRWFADTGAMKSAYNSATNAFSLASSVVVAVFCFFLGNIVTRNIGQVAMRVKGSPTRSSTMNMK